MKTYQHILFWMAAHAILTLIFGKWFQGYVEAFYYVSLLLPVVMATSYFFNYYLVPRFLFTRRFFQFGLYTIYMLIVSLCMELLTSVLAMLLIVRFGINRTGALVTDVFTLAGVLYFVVLLKSFILLIRHYYTDQGTISSLEEERQRREKGFLEVLSQRRSLRIPYEEIRYVESLSDYVKIHRDDGSEVISKVKISMLDRELPEWFLRIHRSFIVHTEKIDSFSREEIVLGETVLPVSRSFRKEVMEQLQPL